MSNQFWLAVCGCLFFLALALAEYDGDDLILTTDEMEETQ